ncbi:type II toxin-antitoxin system HicA family toxin [Candidatus Kaiserbacteria bacterium]|nr:type II toxin-antitoxin system HicA family toxin [Candidatus Kaiserbacteria bacterium]
MPRLPRAREVARAIQKLGFHFARQKGSHAIYRHADGRRITVPVHGGQEIGPATFRQILKDAGMSATQFWNVK